jgi:hypothetical protein
MAISVKHKFVSAIPDAGDPTIVQPSNWNDTHDLTGFGTSATLDAGVANGVATLDGSGTVPISQLPSAVLGALSYQGTWNASTNTPTLTSSVGTKGYYYVVNVAGSTNLNGITDWLVGDWAVYNGTAWQKVDNTDAVTSVNGYTGTVVLTNTDITGFGTMSTQNANSVAITGGTINGASIGATTASTGAFTYVSTSSTTSTTPTLSFNGSNSNIASGATIAGSYLQNILQNKSSTAGASTNYVLSNDLGTDSSYYGEFGMNSSVYSASTPIDFYSINNGVYFSSHDGDVTVGSGNGFKYYLAWGSSGQSAHVINATGAIGLNTNLGTTPALSGTTNFGTSGQVLTSGGSSATPTWTTPTTGTVTSVTGTSPVVSSGGSTPAISMPVATTSVNGYLSSTDWTTFNNKGSGSVTSVGLSAPALFTVTGSPVTGSGTLALTYSGTALPAANGGTGLTSPGTTGNVLTSNGSAWVSQSPTPTSSSYTRTTQTATASQTTFSVTYTAPYIAVYLNGVLLNTVDYTATNGTTVVLATGATVGDLLDFISFTTSSIAVAGGSNTQIQYNSSGNLAGNANFTYTGNDVNIPFGPTNSATSSVRIGLALSMMS